ncbi:MAG: hypothetical protein NZ957_03840 [Thaumarchaeota archaeon]|nr:hypothetical protein [Candidatus Calditenuaceae archaeon]MDW8041790.1 hypothetical protein [Nitrososphaerota archaeon]
MNRTELRAGSSPEQHRFVFGFREWFERFAARRALKVLVRV